MQSTEPLHSHLRDRSPRAEAEKAALLALLPPIERQHGLQAHDLSYLLAQGKRRALGSDSEQLSAYYELGSALRGLQDPPHLTLHLLPTQFHHQQHISSTNTSTAV